MKVLKLDNKKAGEGYPLHEALQEEIGELIEQEILADLLHEDQEELEALWQGKEQQIVEATVTRIVNVVEEVFKDIMAGRLSL